MQAFQQLQVQNQLSAFHPSALIPQPLLPILGEGEPEFPKLELLQAFYLSSRSPLLNFQQIRALNHFCRHDFVISFELSKHFLSRSYIPKDGIASIEQIASGGSEFWLE